MPRSFDTKEREQIKITLSEAGERLFSKYGHKKTTVDDIAKEAGIAKGSFYSFFPSKEALYFHILEGMEESIHTAVIEEIFRNNEDPSEILKKMILAGFRTIDEHPMLMEIFDPSVYQQILRKLSGDEVAAHQKRDENRLIPLIRIMQEKGEMGKRDPKVVTALIRGLFILTLHKREIGEELFPEMIELLAESISRGLCSPQVPRKEK